MRRLRFVGVVIVVVLTGFVGAVRLVAPTSPELRMVGDNPAGVGIGNAAYDEPLGIGSSLLCVTAPATATIRRVALHEPTADVRIEAFAVRPNPYTRGQYGLGGERKSLAEVGGGFDAGAAQQVSGVCPTEAQLNDTAVASKLSELGVQVSWSSGDLAGGSGLDLTYEIGGVERSAFVPFGIRLCTAICPDDVGT